MFNIIKTQIISHVSRTIRPISQLCNSLYNTNKNQIYFQQNRNVFFYRPGEVLWEAVTGPLTQATKRARGKRRILRNPINLNRNRKLGENRLNISWPALRYTATEEDNNKDTFVEVRSKTAKKYVKKSIPPLARGWVGSRINGQSLSNALRDINEIGTFDSRVIVFRFITQMTGTKGRYRLCNTLIASGNGNGVIGIGKSTRQNSFSSLRLSRLKALKNLEYFNLNDNRTIFHPTYKVLHKTKMYAKPLPPNTGIIANRLITTLCKLIGIKDIYVKTEGSIRNHHTLTHLFLSILREQESYQQTADKLGLNVVEIRQDHDSYPLLKAKPNLDPDNMLLSTKQFIGSPEQQEIIDGFLPFHNYYVNKSIYIRKRSKTCINKKHNNLFKNAFLWKHRNKKDIALYNRVLHDLNVKLQV